jgi:hypothetical protein
MWSGPRNLSTAMMRSFGARTDTAVVDEPFYAAYLARTGLDHPLRAEVLAVGETDPARVAAGLLGPVPGGAAIFYQKHMTHHMLGGFERGWIEACRHAFLIRAPERVLASYTARRADVTLEDIGFVRQAELFDEAANRLGRPPPVIDAEDVLADPERTLAALCQGLEIAFTPAMLAWPSGPRPTDGVWAPAWYEAVERSTGFGRPAPAPPPLAAPLARLADAARPHYERLARYRM